MLVLISLFEEEMIDESLRPVLDGLEEEDEQGYQNGLDDGRVEPAFSLSKLLDNTADTEKVDGQDDSCHGRIEETWFNNDSEKAVTVYEIPEEKGGNNGREKEEEGEDRADTGVLNTTEWVNDAREDGNADQGESNEPVESPMDFHLREENKTKAKEG